MKAGVPFSPLFPNAFLLCLRVRHAQPWCVAQAVKPVRASAVMRFGINLRDSPANLD
jgi:hypothetical protein